MWEIEKLKEYADVYGKAEAVMDAIAAKLRKEPEEEALMRLLRASFLRMV